MSEKNPSAVALGRLGGLKGGPARAAKLGAHERREMARKAAAARWGLAPWEVRLFNTLDAIPSAIAAYASAEVIYSNAAKPKLSLRETEEVLRDLALAGDLAQTTQDGVEFYRSL